VFSIAIAAVTGVEVDPAAIAGIVLVISTYIVGQGLVDKPVGQAQVEGSLNVGKLQLELYAKNLEAQFAEVTNELEVTKAAVELTAVPDVE